MADAADRSLVLVSEHPLVGDALAVALVDRGFDVARGAWGTSPRTTDVTSVLVSDLADSVSIDVVRRTLRRHPGVWLLVTDAPRGPLWGAALDAGATSVLPASATLDTLETTLLQGKQMSAPAGARALRKSWRRLDAEREMVRRRLAELSERELEVLRHLYSGESASEIARRLGTSPGTVRSQVKSILRKLHVSSQLTAVAAYAMSRHVATPGGPEVPAAVRPVTTLTRVAL